jgi:hypothetical protein
MTRRCLLLLVLTLCFVLGAASSAAANTANTFITVCAPVAGGPQQMDPIVYPGQLPAGHLHEFFGNTTINPLSNGDQLVADGEDAAGSPTHTTCRDRFDTAAYWVPTLYKDGVRVAPKGLDAYYQRLAGFPAVVVPPTDFRMIAGSHTATAPQDPTKVEWHCMGQPGTFAKSPPACSGQLGLDVRFPNCWDGGSDLQANNTNNVVYPTGNSCPPSNSTVVPKILLTIHYPGASKPDCHLVRAPSDGVNCYVYTFSEFDEVTGQLNDQGSIYGGHADFLNGWNPNPDTSPLDSGPLDFASLIRQFDNAPSGAAGCDNTCTQSDPTGDAYQPIY